MSEAQRRAQPERGAEAPVLQIGSVTIAPPLVLGPMAGYTSLPFRLLCRRAGAGLVVSEMISAKALQFGSEKTRRLMETDPAEQPVVFQIFGGEPETMAAAAEECVARGAQIVDLNMGCTVPKIRRSGAGVELMADPDRAVRIAAAVVRAVPVPVTVKFRAGLTWADESYLELGRRLADVGIAALTLHARPACAQFRGAADWTRIARLVEQVSIPVIGNGDVVRPEQAVLMQQQTGCAGVMIARGALGRPWIFRQAREALEGRPISPDAGVKEALALAICHAQMLALLADEQTAVRKMRGQIGFYTRGWPHAARLRERCQQAQTVRELAALLLEYAEAQDNASHRVLAIREG